MKMDWKINGLEQKKWWVGNLQNLENLLCEVNLANCPHFLICLWQNQDSFFNVKNFFRREQINYCQFISTLKVVSRKMEKNYLVRKFSRGLWGWVFFLLLLTSVTAWGFSKKIFFENSTFFYRIIDWCQLITSNSM